MQQGDTQRNRHLSLRSICIPEPVSAEQAIHNHPIQASSSGHIQVRDVPLYGILPAGAHIVLVVHDEIVLECPEPLAEETTELLKEASVEACCANLKTVHIPEPEVLQERYWKKG